MASALILDCDGVIADTERFGHLVAFNQTFEEFGLPVRWSVADYQEKLLIGGGKERMASLLTPEFVAAAGPARGRRGPAGGRRGLAPAQDGDLPGPRGQRRRPATAGDRPPRRRGPRRRMAGSRRLHERAGIGPGHPRARRRPDLARSVRVFAGDVVPRKKPAPDIYLLALRELGVAAADAVVVEDSRNGLLAATGAGIACLITVNDFTAGEDFSEAALVVSSLGDPGDPPVVVLANRSRATPGELVTLADLASLKGAPMPTADLADVEAVVHTIAEVAVANEKYFGDLDSVVGDGDFGYSMARGFELVLSGWADFDRADIGTFLKKIAVTITSRIGGTSGPIWGTAFLRAGAKAGTATELSTDQVIEMLRAAIEGIKARGKSDVGDKTLLDALVPAVDALEERARNGESAAAALKAAALVAREQRGGHARHARQARPGRLHRRAVHRHPRRGCRRGRRHVRGARRRVGEARRRGVSDE